MRTLVSNTTAGSHLLAGLVQDVTVLDVQVEPEVVLLTVTPSSSTAACPRCSTESARIHSYYIRQPHDLPISGRATRLLVHARRFRCVNPACSTVTFAERLPNLVAVAAQRTVRLNTELRDLALAFGGEAGARQTVRSAMPASGDTLLRRAHSATLLPRATPRVLGLDDFAFQKGRRYGTILTDGETKDVVDVLPDRTAETVAAWLKEHPGIEVVTRDRSTEYARGVTTGAPDAVQVADRWHVLGNLREALERLLDRLRPHLLALPLENHQSSPSLRSIDRDRRRGTKDQARQQASRLRRYTRYADVKRLQAEGKAILQIACELKLSRQTVRKYMASDRFPEYPQLRQQRSILDPYVALLQAQWDAGCHTNRQLLEAIRAEGYQGSLRPIVQWTMLRRPSLPGYRPPAGRRPARVVERFVPPEEHAAPQSGGHTLPASRRLVWLLFHFDDRLDEDAQQQRSRLCSLPDLQAAWALARQFREMVRDRRAEALDPWISACRASDISELKSFADGLEREEDIIRAALELPFSNGVSEGHVHRLKMIKRTGYGRASFRLLRQRVLAKV